MEGITGALFRRTHRRFFPGWTGISCPSLPSQHHVFTRRELRDILPEQDGDLDAVPQLLTRSGADFLWAAGELARMGYREVNLNLGCPSGTVTAKGGGRDAGAAGGTGPPAGGHLLRLPTAVSVKTRLGIQDPEEFWPILDIYNKYPIAQLIVHTRVREDLYRRPARPELFPAILAASRSPVLQRRLVTAADCRAFSVRFPGAGLMMGRGWWPTRRWPPRPRAGPARTGTPSARSTTPSMRAMPVTSAAGATPCCG